MVLGAFVFPAALEAPPENRGIETVTSYPELPTEPTEPDDSPSINAISKEQAVEIATDAINAPPPEGIIYKAVTMALAATKYLESNDPAGDPSWTIIMSESKYGYPNYVSIEINALTGEVLALRGVDIEGISIESLNELDGDEFRQSLVTIPTPPESEPEP
jgi:hypothetical protein